MKRKNFLLVGVIILVALIYNLLGNYVRQILQKPVQLKLESTASYSGDLEKFQLTDNGIISWDGSFLKFADLSGNILNEMPSNGYDCRVLFGRGSTFFLDKQLKALYTYNDFGKLENKTTINGNPFNVKFINSKVYLHKKENLTQKEIESISILQKDGKTTELYETEGFIVNFFAKGSTLYVVEISTDFYGYNSSLIVVKGDNKKRYEFNNETVLGVKPMQGRIIAVTDKKLYSIKGEKKDGLAIDGIKDFMFEEDRVAILAADSLEIFSSKLRSLEKYTVGIGNDRLFYFQNGYFVYGPTEMLAFVGQKREFNFKFDSLAKDIKTKNRTIGVMYKDRIELYTLEPIPKGDKANE